MLISADSCVRVWNQQNTSLAYSFDVGVNKINDISFTRDGRILLIASDTDRIQLIDMYKIENPPELIVTKDKSQAPIHVTAIGCSSDGQKIGVGSSSGVINVFNTKTHEKIYSSYVHRKQISSICFHPFTNNVIASDSNGKISFSSLDGGTPKMLPHWTSKSGQIFEFDSSPHKPLLAVACRTGIIFYDLEKMNKETPPIPKFTGYPTHIRFSPSDPNIIAFSSNINEVYFFNLSSKSLRSPIVFDDNILSMDFRNDGIYLAVSFANTGIVTIDVRDSSIQHKYCTDNTSSSYVVKFQPVDINEDPKFKQTLVSEAPKITKPTIQPSKSSDSRKFPAPIEKKKNNTFSRVVQSKNPKNPKSQQKIAKLNDKIDDLNNDIDKSNSDNYNENEKQSDNIEIEEKTDLLQKDSLQRPSSSSSHKDIIQQKPTSISSQKGSAPSKPNLPSPSNKNIDEERSPTRKVGSPKEPSSPKQKHNLQLQRQQQTNAHSSPPRPTPQPSIPTNAPQIIRQEDESDDEDDIDLSKVPVESREMIKVICNYIKDINETTKEELHQHLNTIHLDILCRIREIEDKLNILMQKNMK